MQKHIILLLFFFLFKSSISFGIDCSNGTLLFKEDFGGNNISDDFIKQSGINQVIGYTYVILPNRYATLTNNSYTISKQGHYIFGYMMDDHTYPGDITKGYLLQVYTDSVSNQIYKTQLDNLCAGVHLNFSAWLASVKGCGSTCPDSSKIAFIIEKPDGTILKTYTTGNLPNGSPFWKKYGFDYTVEPSVNSIVFKIINNTENPNPNSFVIDDIEVVSCQPEVDVNVLPKSSVCLGENVTLTGDFENNGNFAEPIEYKWLFNATGDLTNQTTWNQVGTGKVLALNSITASSQGYYRLVVNNADSINFQNCGAMSDPLFMEVNTGCTANIVQANNDTLVITKNNIGLINVIFNDQYTSCEASNINLSIKTKTPNTSSAYFNVNDELVYTPVQDFVGKDSVLYEIECNGQKSDAWVYIQILSQNYVKNDYTACPTAIVNLELNTQAGETYSWYSAENGGSLLGSGASLTFTKTTKQVDIVWLQINTNSSRIPICIYLSSLCGEKDPSFCNDGTILFKEDFEGNNISDPVCKANGISQVAGYTYGCGTSGSGSYSIMKYSNNRDVWYEMDDHTFPSDFTRGYLLIVDATESAGQFYEYQIDNLCSGSHLLFSTWISSLERDTTWEDKTNVIFELEKLDGTTLTKYYTGNVPDGDPSWKEYGFEFTVPNDLTSVVLKIINNGSGSNGNDFVMDDIEIRICVPPVTISVSPNDTICKNQSVTFTANFTNDGTFSEPLVYKWFKSSTGSYDDSDWTEIGTGEILTLNSVSKSDQDYYRVAVSNAGNIDLSSCRAMSIPLFLTVDSCNTNPPDNLTVSANTITICKGRSAQLSANGAVSYQWSPTTGLSSSTISNPIASPTQTTSYAVTGTFADATTQTQTITVNVIEPISKTLSKNICGGDSFIFGGKTLITSGTYHDTLVSSLGCDSIVTLYLYITPAFTTTQSKNIYEGQPYTINGHEYKKDGIYKDTLKTSFGCDSIVITNLSVIPANNCPDIIIPTFFTPNDDGLNDIWLLKNIECYTYHDVEIFDRFGKMLRHWENNFTGWDGIYLGKPMPSSDYWYIIKLNERNWPIYVGHFSLIRH